MTITTTEAVALAGRRTARLKLRPPRSRSNVDRNPGNFMPKEPPKGSRSPEDKAVIDRKDSRFPALRAAIARSPDNRAASSKAGRPPAANTVAVRAAIVRSPGSRAGSSRAVNTVGVRAAIGLSPDNKVGSSDATAAAVKPSRSADAASCVTALSPTAILRNTAGGRITPGDAANGCPQSSSAPITSSTITTTMTCGSLIMASSGFESAKMRCW